MAEWNHNIAYHGLVLGAVPAGCGRALDLGCGGGLLVRRLAGVCDQVSGIDVSAAMIGAAMASEHAANTDFVVGDAMTYPFAAGSFALITAVATLHHLPLEAALMRFRELLAPGGVLVVIGLYRAEGVRDAFFSAAGLVASRTIRGARGFGSDVVPMRAPRETLGEIRAVAEEVLPGSVVRRRLLFRYSLVWEKG